MVEEGQEAPDVELTSDSGERVRLSKLRGRPVVVYFYPKDDTAGCTTQACGLRDIADQLGDAVVVGVSPDAPARQARFADKYSLGFPLLSDADHAVADAYGAWGERSMYGRKYMGIIRSAFLVDGEGRISHAWPAVKPKDTAPNLLAALAR